MLYVKIGLPRNMSSVIGDSLIFRVETDEFVFEQWDLSASIPTETDPKARAN